MPRNLTAALLAEFQAKNLRPAIFVQIQFTSGISYIWSGVGSVQWNGQTWLGVGAFGNISAIEESSNIQANGVTLSLSGIDSTLIAKALNELRQNYPVQMWFGAIDGGNVVADPWNCFSGRIDVPTVDEGAQTSTISINVESRLIDLQRSRERRYTDQDQQGEFPGDLGFQYVPALQDFSGVWGKSDGALKRLPNPMPIGGHNPNAGAGGGSGTGPIPRPIPGPNLS